MTKSDEDTKRLLNMKHDNSTIILELMYAHRYKSCEEDDNCICDLMLCEEEEDRKRCENGELYNKLQVDT